MDTKDIIFFVAILAFASFRLYQKYIKNKTHNPDNKADTTNNNGSFPKDEDYEPYSGH